MGGVIASILPLAIGTAISPVPVIAVILMLFSARARENGPAFLAGWVVGLVAVVLIVLVIGGAIGIHTGGPSTLASLLLVALGIFLLFRAARRWQHRPAAGEATELPAWMHTVDDLAPSRAFVLGVLLSGVNPKNLSLAVGAALVMGAAALGLVELLVAIVVFVLLASLTIIVPVAYALAGGASAQGTLETWRAWLTQHEAVVMTLLLVVFGVILVSKGIGQLIG